MNESGINPTGHHVLVLPDKIQDRTEGGIYLAPQTIEEKQRSATRGVVIAIGVTAWSEFASGNPWAAVGDYVSYAQYGGIDITGLDKRRYVLLNDQDILACLRQADAPAAS